MKPGSGGASPDLLFRRQAEAFFAGGVAEANEKRLLNEREGSGNTVRSVPPADFSLNTGRFTEGREKLVGNEELKKSGPLGRAGVLAPHPQKPVSNK